MSLLGLWNTLFDGVPVTTFCFVAPKDRFPLLLTPPQRALAACLSLRDQRQKCTMGYTDHRTNFSVISGATLREASAVVSVKKTDINMKTASYLSAHRGIFMRLFQKAQILMSEKNVKTFCEYCIQLYDETSVYQMYYTCMFSSLRMLKIFLSQTAIDF